MSDHLAEYRDSLVYAFQDIRRKNRDQGRTEWSDDDMADWVMSHPLPAFPTSPPAPSMSDPVRAALAEIAKQKMSDELTDDQRDEASFEDGWDEVICIARKALSSPPDRCPYCGPDGTMYRGDGGDGKICPYCHGSAESSPPTDLPSETAMGDEDAGEANVARSYARVRAVHGENYASVGDAEWDARVLADEVDRLKEQVETLRTVAKAYRACHQDCGAFPDCKIEHNGECKDCRLYIAEKRIDAALDITTEEAKK